jgi:hypothetical protein
VIHLPIGNQNRRPPVNFFTTRIEKDDENVKYPQKKTKLVLKQAPGENCQFVELLAKPG